MRNVPVAAPLTSLPTRVVRFEDVPDVLRLIRRAIEGGCRDHYDRRQRDAVFASYATTLFADALGPFETVAAERDGRIVAVAQLDAPACRLRALFVDAGLQRTGVGRALLADVEARARRRRCATLLGAMSMNAVPFYTRAGFRVCAGPEVLTTSAVAVPVVRMEKDL